MTDVIFQKRSTDKIAIHNWSALRGGSNPDGRPGVVYFGKTYRLPAESNLKTMVAINKKEMEDLEQRFMDAVIQEGLQFEPPGPIDEEQLAVVQRRGRDPRTPPYRPGDAGAVSLTIFTDPERQA